jgi:hypothetical protein
MEIPVRTLQSSSTALLQQDVHGVEVATMLRPLQITNAMIN